MTVAFFHQHEVHGVQGGVERFLATLLDQANGQAYLVCEKTEETLKNRLGLILPFNQRVPQWIRYIVAVLINIRAIRTFLSEKHVTAMEFSRPEYAIFAIFFPGRKTFTFHGTGPLPKEIFKWMIHFGSCWLLPFCADTIQIVGRSSNGLPRILQSYFKNKMCFVDAWYDDCFAVASYPKSSKPLRILYAGRLATAKNPELLFEVMRELNKRFPDTYRFVYCGADSLLIPDDLAGSIVDDLGLLSAQQLAAAIRGCHFGILTSHTEGSPFIVIESLACGRGFLLPPVVGLLKAYNQQFGVVFSPSYKLEDYIDAIVRFGEEIISGRLPAEKIAESVKTRSKVLSSKTVFNNIQHGNNQ